MVGRDPPFEILPLLRAIFPPEGQLASWAGQGWATPWQKLTQGEQGKRHFVGPADLPRGPAAKRGTPQKAADPAGQEGLVRRDAVFRCPPLPRRAAVGSNPCWGPCQ